NNKYVTTYFRRAFDLESAGLYCGELDMRVRRDDGVVVYLNGQEVFRNNMPGGSIDYLTTATASVQGADETDYLQFAVDGHLLVDGQNVIAVEIHQFSASSSDISFDLDLTYSSSDINWCIPGVALSPGVTTLKVTAEDLAGNKETEQIEINLVEGGGAIPPPGGGTTTGAQHRADNDFDGDGISDIAVYRASDITWFVFQSTDGQMTPFIFGAPEDIPVPADYDGDGHADFAVFRPSTVTWYVFGTSAGAMEPFQYGAPGDLPAPADYDGDGRADIAIYRPSTMTWYVFGSSDGAWSPFQYGGLGDIPVPADYDGDGQADLAVFRPSTVQWFIFGSSTGSQLPFQYGGWGDVPVPGDYDGDGLADAAIFRPSTVEWYIRGSSDGQRAPFQYGAYGDQAVR
ncbi:MAG: VCBS repeat-containing protein, partial [Verrucomicrobia bacterium]|nr:VCBS repeat-containing protein [Verrucomicrobiota bacterium]